MRYGFLILLVGVVACRPAADQPAADTTASVAPPAPAPLALADLAGTWDMKSMAEGSDSVLVTFELMATADTTGWMQHFAGRDPIPMRVLAVAGDSVITETGPFESVLRPGVQVTTHSVMRLQDGRLVGTTIARYKTSGPDSVVRIRTEGTRRP
ncbi:MAG TPA: hypothetical protein VFO95_15285 [Gemmatimonadales bacterium]|nr:hypothetical protein [Gemmatimonadales bacterium]